MKRVLALILAVAMLATLNVGALAEETESGIVTYGGGGFGLEDCIVLTNPLDPTKTYTEQELVDLFSNYDITMNVGDTHQLYLYTIKRDEAGESFKVTHYTGKATWTSKDPMIVTIDDNGLIKAIGTGDWPEGVALFEISVEVSKDETNLQFDTYWALSGRVLAAGAKVVDDTVVLKPADNPSATTLEVAAGTTVQMGAFTKSDMKPYTNYVQWKVVLDNASISDTGLVSIPSTIRFDRNANGSYNSKGTGDYAVVTIAATTPAAKSRYADGFVIKVMKDSSNIPTTPDDPTKPDPKPPVTDPDNPNPDQPKPPVDPEEPDQPTPQPPVVDSGTAPADKTPQATDNAANDDKTTDALASGKAAEVKVSNGSAAISVGTANLLGGSSGKLTLVNNGMTVVLPGGFGKVTEAGRVYFPFDYEQSPKHAAEMLAAVKTEGAKSEAVKAGGVMTLPTTATVTLKTKLTGTVNVYLYNEDTGKLTLIASPAAKDGTVTFATRQMGYFLLTTGRV